MNTTEEKICENCKRPINMGNSPNAEECTEPYDDEGLCAAYARIASLQLDKENLHARLAKAKAEIEADALVIEEGARISVELQARNNKLEKELMSLRALVNGGSDGKL